MNKLTEEQKEKALKRFVYCQEYYESINHNTKMSIFKIQINILIKLNQIQKNQKNIKTKKKEYYERVGKERYAKLCEKKRALKEKLLLGVLEPENTVDPLLEVV